MDGKKLNPFLDAVQIKAAEAAASARMERFLRKNHLRYKMDELKQEIDNLLGTYQTHRDNETLAGLVERMVEMEAEL